MDQQLWLFALFVFGVIVLPGMDMAHVLSSSLVDGRRAGLAAVAGMVVGGIVHLAMGALGVGLLFALFPALFAAVLVAGALYVGWMGVALWRAPAALTEVTEGVSQPAHRTFLRAVATCLLNPKAYVFMVAVFPQFLRPGQGNLLAQVVALGAITAATQALVYGAVALGAASLRSALRRSAAQQVLLARSVGGLLVGTAAWALWKGLAAS